MDAVDKRGKDPVAKVGLMLVRLGFVIALILGLGMLTRTLGSTGVLHGHQGAGFLVLIGIWLAAIRLASQKRSGMGPVWAAAVLSLIGAFLGRYGMRGEPWGIIHMVVMLLTIGLAEMGVGRAQKA